MTPATENRAQTIAVVQKLLTVVLFWGANAVVLKYLTGHLDSMVLVTLRMFLSAAISLPVVLMHQGFVRLPVKGWVLVGAVSLLTFTLHQLAMTWGMARTSGTHGVLILGLMPLSTMALASFFLKERLGWTKLLAVALGFGGIALIAFSKDQSHGATLLGDAIMFVAVAAYAIGSIFVKKSTAYADPLVITAYGMVLSAILVAALSLTSDNNWTQNLERMQWGPIAGLIFVSWFSTALGTFWWNTGIHHLGATTTSLFFNGVPIVGVFASVAFLDERLMPAHYVALVLILAAISLGSGIFRPKPR